MKNWEHYAWELLRNATDIAPYPSNLYIRGSVRFIKHRQKWWDNY